MFTVIDGKSALGGAHVSNGGVAEEQLVVRTVVPVREQLRDRGVLLVVEAVGVRAETILRRRAEERVELRLAVVVAQHEPAVVRQHEIEAPENVRERIRVGHRTRARRR